MEVAELKMLTLTMLNTIFNSFIDPETFGKSCISFKALNLEQKTVYEHFDCQRRRSPSFRAQRLTAKDGNFRLYSFIAEIDVVAPCG